jgi:hypothetical protein
MNRFLVVWLLISCAFLASGLSNTPNLFTCSSSIELERAVSFFCRPGDCVLEMGAQLSDASLKLCQIVGPEGKAFLVDVERSDAKSGRCSHRDIQGFDNFKCATTMVLPTLEEWKERLFSGKEHYDVIIVDLGHIIGNDLYLTTLSLANDILSEANPRVMLVKSKSLSSLARRLVPSQRLLDGSWVLPREGLIRSHEPFIFPAVGVSDYRSTIPFTVQPGDAVLEVGCHFGTTTHLLHEATKNTKLEEGQLPGLCIGVDIGPKIIRNAKSQYPGITFEVGDAWRTLELLKMRSDGGLGYDVVYADIGGLSGAHGVIEALSLVDSLANSLEPRCIVIKSLCMRRLGSRLKPFSEVWAKQTVE